MDIQGFFDNIPRDYLKTKIRRVLRSHSLVPLLEAVVDTEARVRSSDRHKAEASGIRAGVGLRQGMPLSPILANLCLAEFDSRIERAGYNMIRYSDDIAMFFDTKEECQAALLHVKEELRLNLTVPDLDLSKPALSSKTSIIAPTEPLAFLGREIAFSRPAGTFVIRVGKQQIRKIRKNLHDEYSLRRARERGWNLSRFATSLGAAVGSYLGVYRDVNDYEALRAHLHECAHQIMKNLLQDIFGQGVSHDLSKEHQDFLGIPSIEFEPLGYVDA
jgi:hypothetical protein